LTSAQSTLLNAYCSQLNVKLVVLSDAPDGTNGVALVPSSVGPAWGGSGDDQNIRLSDIGIALAQSAKLSADSTTTYSSAGLFHYNGKITDPTKATAVAYFDPFSNHFPSQTVAAANYTTSSGVQKLSFYLPFASWSSTSSALGVIWLNWVSNGEFPVVFNFDGSIPLHALVLSRRTFTFLFKSLDGVLIYTL
jgi:hypothetical protein